MEGEIYTLIQVFAKGQFNPIRVLVLLYLGLNKNLQILTTFNLKITKVTVEYSKFLVPCKFLAMKSHF